MDAAENQIEPWVIASRMVMVVVVVAVIMRMRWPASVRMPTTMMTNRRAFDSAALFSRVHSTTLT